MEEMLSSQNSRDDISAMLELVKQEQIDRKFEFFYKLRSKYLDNHEQGVYESDLAAIDPHWYLKR